MNYNTWDCGLRKVNRVKYVRRIQRFVRAHRVSGTLRDLGNGRRTLLLPSFPLKGPLPAKFPRIAHPDAPASRANRLKAARSQAGSSAPTVHSACVRPDTTGPVPPPNLREGIRNKPPRPSAWHRAI